MFQGAFATNNVVFLNSLQCRSLNSARDAVAGLVPTRAEKRALGGKDLGRLHVLI